MHLRRRYNKVPALQVGKCLKAGNIDRQLSRDPLLHVQMHTCFDFLPRGHLGTLSSSAILPTVNSSRSDDNQKLKSLKGQRLISVDFSFSPYPKRGSQHAALLRSWGFLKSSKNKADSFVLASGQETNFGNGNVFSGVLSFPPSFFLSLFSLAALNLYGETTGSAW